MKYGTQTDNTDLAKTAAAGKKPYKAPTVTNLGAVKDLTLGAPDSADPDSGALSA